MSCTRCLVKIGLMHSLIPRDETWFLKILRWKVEILLKNLTCYFKWENQILPDTNLDNNQIKLIMKLTTITLGKEVSIHSTWEVFMTFWNKRLLKKRKKERMKIKICFWKIWSKIKEILKMMCRTIYFFEEWPWY